MPLPERLFVTGTDTGVGKTVVTAALAASAPDSVGLKPLASGVPAGQPGEDAALLALATGDIPDTYRSWPPPVSPHRAALDTGISADRSEALAWIGARCRRRTYVEGVGGWRVPVQLGARGWGIPELACGLGWPVLVVACNRLGVLNHTLLTTSAIRAAGLPLAGVVLNDVATDLSPDDSGPARERNLEDLRLLLDVPVAPFPALPTLSRSALAAAGAALRAALQSAPAGPRPLRPPRG